MKLKNLESYPETYTVRARWGIDLHGDPRPRPTLKIHQGKIVSVEFESDRLVVDSSSIPNENYDLGDVCILPSFFNAHTHLEFSDLRSPLPASGGFCDWISSVVKLRMEEKNRLIMAGGEPAWVEQRRRSYLAGIDESGRCGVSHLIDMATVPWDASWIANCSSAPSLGDWETIVVEPHFELLAPTQERLSESQARLATLASEVTVHRCGLAPHAPYTTPIELVRASVELAQKNKWTVSMHLAESVEEMEWLKDRTGPMRQMLDRFALEFSRNDLAGNSILDYLQLLSKAPKSLVVHGNYLEGAEMDFLEQHRDSMAVVYCPRTHSHFGHTHHPWQELRKRGIQVMLGTDSRASNPDLDILEEASFLYRNSTGVSPRDILAMITSVPFKFLDSHGKDGSLQPGATFNRRVVPCNARSSDQVLEALLTQED